MNRLTPTHFLMTIENYINGFVQRTYNLPIWQREDCWDDDYRQQLIHSILQGIDLPKIYIGDINNIGKVIIDGGHRTRTLNSFMNNEFFIVISDEKVFYTDDPSNNSIRNHRILTDEEREYFNKYEISITTYTNINESMARNIFNKLQNAEPMTIQDVINSWESPLVDYLRNQKHLITNGRNLYDHFTDIRGLPKPENSELLYQCLSFWTIINPLNDPGISESESALKYLEKGKTRESKCFKYLKEYDNRYHGNITDEKKNRFVEGIDFIIEYLLGRPLPMADMNTLIYSKFWVPSFSVDKFTELSNTIDQYNTLKKAADRARKNHNYDLQITTNRAADLLNSQNNGFLEQWIKTRTSGGSSEKAMRVRNDIILQKCLNIEDEDDTESNSDAETNSDDNPDMVSVDIVESL
jgi:hypothetical protein